MPKNLKITFLILIIILSGAFIFYYSFWPKFFSPSSSLTNKSDKSPSPLSPITDAQRLELLNKASKIPPINPNMTYKERLELLNKPSNIPPL